MDISVGDEVWLVSTEISPGYTKELVVLISKNSDYVIKDPEGLQLRINKDTLLSRLGHFTIKPVTKEEKTKMLIGTLDSGT